MFGDDRVAGDHRHPRRVQPRAHHLPDQLARHRVAVARHAGQTGAAHPGVVLDVAVERCGHRHELVALEFEHLGHAELLVLGVPDLAPQFSAPLAQPCVEFGQAAPFALARLDPDAPAAVLHVLLDNALLPAAGDVAEVGVEQVVRAHRREPLVDDPPLALLDLVDGGLHVVVDAAQRDAAQRRKAFRVGIEQHLVALTRVGHQPERPARAQLHVRHLQLAVNPANDQRLVAPVELERLSQLERQRHEGLRCAGAVTLNSPLPNEVGQPRVAAGVTRLADLLVQRLRRAALLLRAMRIDLQRLLDGLDERSQLARHRRPPVLRLLARRLFQPLGHRVARQARHLGNLAHALVPAAVQPSDLANHVHGDHSYFPAAQKCSRLGQTPGSSCRKSTTCHLGKLFA